MIALYDVLLVVVIFGQLFLTPFTKVEESFNIQAIHDIIHHGLNLDAYDHLEFPGPVPRTFIGSIIISLITKGVVSFFPPAGSKLDAQLVARGVLGIINTFGILTLKNAVVSQIKRASKIPTEKKLEKKDQKRGKNKIIKQQEAHNSWSLGLWFAVLTYTQFHLTYYSSRTIPNFIALPLTNIAFSRLIRGDYGSSIALFAFTAVVFRIEVVILTLATGLVLFLFNKVTIPQLIKYGLIGGLSGITLSGTIDSFFWRRFTVPELESFVFNVIEGKSSEWGTEPFTKYFSKYLLTLFLPPIVPLLSLIGFLFDTTGIDSLRISFLSSILYVVLISFQPHKEWRFLAYTIPVISVLGANGASYITAKAAKSYFYKLLVLVVFACASLSALINIAWTLVSSYNYPGGYAINKFHDIIIQKVIDPNSGFDPTKQTTVHFDVASAMTGITKFTELSSASGINIKYDKTEDPAILPRLWQTFDYIITAIDLDNYKGDAEIPVLENWRWTKVGKADGFSGIDPRGFSTLVPEEVIYNVIMQRSFRAIGEAIRPFVKTDSKIYIYERVSFERAAKNEDKLEDDTANQVEDISELVEELLSVEDVTQDAAEQDGNIREPIPEEFQKTSVELKP